MLNMFGVMTDTTETTSGATPLPFQIGSALFYLVVAVGSILTLLITCIMVLVLVLSLCIGCICLQRNRASTCIIIFL